MAAACRHLRRSRRAAVNLFDRISVTAGDDGQCLQGFHFLLRLCRQPVHSKSIWLRVGLYGFVSNGFECLPT